jgi:hypothetical protein
VSLLLLGGASALGYGRTPLRAFVFVGVGNEEKCMAAPCYIELWNSIRKKGRSRQTKEEGDVRR